MMGKELQMWDLSAIIIQLVTEVVNGEALHNFSNVL